MFKKLFLLGAALALAAAVGGISTPVQAAGIAGTAHEQTSADGGPCAACHLPHGAQGSRLWVDKPNNAAPNLRGFVAPLCGYCHSNVGGQNSYGTDSSSTTWVFGGLSHAVLMSTAGVPRSTAWSNLQYHVSGGSAVLGVIQCTTCHDVHNDVQPKRPFLRGNINVICASCHANRQWAGGSTLFQSGDIGTIGTFQAWGTANLQKKNPGSHPVGTDITGNIVSEAPITIWRSMKIAFSATAADWSLGGHMQNGWGGGMTCLTCHAVHGIRYDKQPANVDNKAPVANMLVIEQNTGMTDVVAVGINRTVSNGGNDPRNALCEGCHFKPGNLFSFYGNQAGAQLTSTQGHMNPNPGNTLYTHPVDIMRIGANWVPNNPDWPTAGMNWPIGNAVGASYSQPNVICESCHVPHPAANGFDLAGAANPRNDLKVAPSRATSNQYILRAKAADICKACHLESLAQHHPVGKGFNVQGVTYLAGVKSAGWDTLECGTCHGTTGAHNWSGRGAVGLDTGWRPWNNGRDASSAVELFVTSASLTCMDCHAGMAGGALRSNKSPTLHGVANLNGAFDTTYAPVGMKGAPGAANGENYLQIGYGSHALGRIGYGGVGANRIRQNYQIAGYWNSLNSKLGNLFTSTPPTWPLAVYGGNNGWSRFGGNATAPVLVCESCHELQPTKNSTTHLLLGYYAEEYGNAIASSRSNFCEGCHRPSGTHQQSGELLGPPAPNPNNRTLSTVVNANRPFMKNPSDANVVLSNNNKLNCDSCHQPHDANTNSQTFIIDGAAALVAAPKGPFLAGGATWGSYVNDFWPTAQVGKGGSHSDFCKECHNL